MEKVIIVRLMKMLKVANKKPVDEINTENLSKGDLEKLEKKMEEEARKK